MIRPKLRGFCPRQYESHMNLYFLWNDDKVTLDEYNSLELMINSKDVENLIVAETIIKTKIKTNET